MNAYSQRNRVPSIYSYVFLDNLLFHKVYSHFVIRQVVLPQLQHHLSCIEFESELPNLKDAFDFIFVHVLLGQRHKSDTCCLPKGVQALTTYACLMSYLSDEAAPDVVALFVDEKSYTPSIQSSSSLPR